MNNQEIKPVNIPSNPNDIYIVSAHYDSVTNFGADDNASGTAAIIELARILSQYCTENTIIYALWDDISRREAIDLLHM